MRPRHKASRLTASRRDAGSNSAIRDENRRRGGETIAARGWGTDKHGPSARTPSWPATPAGLAAGEAHVGRQGGRSLLKGDGAGGRAGAGRDGGNEAEESHGLTKHRGGWNWQHLGPTRERGPLLARRAKVHQAAKSCTGILLENRAK